MTFLERDFLYNAINKNFGLSFLQTKEYYLLFDYGFINICRKFGNAKLHGMHVTRKKYSKYNAFCITAESKIIFYLVFS